MAKRFTDTEIWKQDWFIDIPIDYKLFWFYLKDNCDHSGIFKVNLTLFCRLYEVKVNSIDALNYFNSDKERIIPLNEKKWFLPDFFIFQYGTKMNLNNKVHKSIYNLYKTNGIELTSCRGLKDLKERVKDKDKDKEKDKDIIINKEVKKKKTKKFKEPVIQEILAYFKDKNFPEEEAYKFYNHYGAVDWFRKGEKIKNWKLQSQTWMRNKKDFTNKNNNIKSNDNYNKAMEEFLND